MPTQQQIIDSHALITGIFKAFRPELMRAYGNTAHDIKADRSPVTQLDVKIETELKKKLLDNFPVFGFKGEETEAVTGSSDATWYIDPIDSTMSFVRGLPYCSNMAGLVVNGEIIASVIYNFVSDELYTAFKGQGAYKNGNRIFVKNLELNDSCVYADAYSYTNIYTYFARDRVRFYAPMGATGYFLTCIAQGSIQGACYFKASIKQHDIIPGVLLVQEAGGDVVSLSGQPFDYNCLRFIIGTKRICNLTNQFRDDIINTCK